MQSVPEYLISKYGKEKFGVNDETSQAWVDNQFCQFMSFRLPVRDTGAKTILP